MPEKSLKYVPYEMLDDDGITGKWDTDYTIPSPEKSGFVVSEADLLEDQATQALELSDEEL